MGQVGVGSGFDDVPAEGEPKPDRRGDGHYGEVKASSEVQFLRTVRLRMGGCPNGQCWPLTCIERAVTAKIEGKIRSGCTFGDVEGLST